MNIQVQYDSLNPEAQTQVDAFLEFVLNQSKHQKTTNFELSSWKRKIKKVSVWEENEIAVFDNDRKKMSLWKAQEW